MYHQVRITRGQFFVYFLLAMVCVLLAGCSLDNAIPTNTTTSDPQQGIMLGSGVQNVQVYVEPSATDRVIIAALNAAQRSVWLEMYLLTDKKIISALEEDAHRGLDVRVMLEPHPYGSGSITPRETLDKLTAAGVKTQASSPDFALTHEKGLLIDGQTAYIMTSNFTLSALGGTKQTTNREYGIIDSNPTDVKSIEAIFNADWQRTQVQINDPNLVVSPENSRAAFVSLINSAQTSLTIEAEEMQDAGIEQALLNVARHNVQVQIVLPAPGNSSTDTNRDGINVLKQAGIHVREDARLYIHAKIIMVDRHRVFVGSENISSASLDKNCELGIVVADQTVINTIQQAFQQDWNDGQNV